MKLASLKDGRDGRLVVVSNDLSRCAVPHGGVTTMQALLDRWDEASNAIKEDAAKLNASDGEGRAFDARECASPLPRAYQWADGSAYVNHVELGAQSPRGRNARNVLDGPADVSGRDQILFLGPTR